VLLLSIDHRSRALKYFETVGATDWDHEATGLGAQLGLPKPLEGRATHTQVDHEVTHHACSHEDHLAGRPHPDLEVHAPKNARLGGRPEDLPRHEGGGGAAIALTEDLQQAPTAIGESRPSGLEETRNLGLSPGHRHPRSLQAEACLPQVSDTLAGMSEAPGDHVIDISVVIPVYAGEATLPALCAELACLRDRAVSPEGRAFRVTEVVLVWDRGPGHADDTIRALYAEYSFIRPVWLSRNFGQHAATLAGMSSSSGEWIVTMDEDGQHDPAFIGAMLDQAFGAQSQLVYASPTNAPPHGFMRNASSRFAKWMFKVLVGDSNLESFNSYRLMMGDVGRSAAAYTGTGVYLDVALAWVVSDVSLCRIPMRSEGRPASNYSFPKLLSHFGRLVISSGTRPLAMVSLLGLVFLALGIIYSIWILLSRLMGGAAPAGWTSTFVSILIVGGLTLFSLGVIAQYIRAATNMSLGKPLYVVVRDPQRVFPGKPSTTPGTTITAIDDQAVRD
jgi:glycosyltransferase involved in cell wall biosynthesis